MSLSWRKFRSDFLNDVELELKCWAFRRSETVDFKAIKYVRNELKIQTFKKERIIKEET